jgi:tetratricopeptide (TPR) repeat protein
MYGIKIHAFRNAREGNAGGDGQVEPREKERVGRLFARFPNNLELLAYCLHASIADGDPSRVAELLASSPPEAVEDNRFWRFKGWLHSARGELQEAVAAYRKALELNPYDAVSCHQWASIERRMGRVHQVKILELLSKEGQELRREILQMPDVTLVDRTLLERIAKYAADCGDHAAADRLGERLHITGF